MSAWFVRGAFARGSQRSIQTDPYVFDPKDVRFSLRLSSRTTTLQLANRETSLKLVTRQTAIKLGNRQARI